MNYTTATTHSMPPLTVEALKEAVAELETLRLPEDWMLIAPDGRVWKAKDPMELAKAAAFESLQNRPFRAFEYQHE